MDSFAALIDKFGGPASFAAAISITAGHAGVMKSRNSIPPGYWAAIVMAARERGLAEVTADLLASWAKPRQRAEPASSEAA